MGEKIKQIFDVVEKHAGNDGRLRLAQKTKIPKPKVMEIPDDPETVASVSQAASEILGKNIADLL